MGILKTTSVTRPDLVEATLVIILTIWIVAVLWLINLGLKAEVITLLTIESLTMFFVAFMSISVLVIAVILADIRKEIKSAY